MADRSPTNLNTSRNIALTKGTVPAGFAPTQLDPSMEPIMNDDEASAAAPTGDGTKPPGGPSPFTKVRGG